MITKHRKLPYLWVVGMILLLLFPLGNTLQAQLYLNGANVHSLGNSVIIVKTDSLILANGAFFDQEGLLIIDKDLVVNDGKLDVDGTIDIEQNLINNDSIEGFSGNSFILLNGNWINNGSFSAGQNSTILDGGVQQIRGSQETNFFNLSAQGALADIKSLIGVNASVLNQLDLTDVEFATGNKNLSVYNPSVNAISRNTGFVSSLDTGRLERATNAMMAYLFPTGSSAGVLRYRPIVITPNTNATDTFGVRLANVEATDEGFDVLVLNDSLCAVNPNFYHRIYGNSDAAITMFYIPQDDGEWDAMAQWQSTSDWNKLPNEFPASSGQFATMTIPSWSDFSDPAFALGLQIPTLDLADEVTIELGQSVNLNANYIGANPQSIMWFPLDEIDCPNCLETDVSPFESTLYNLEITVNQFCTIKDSVLVLVNMPGLFLPTAFSPNIDGVNDSFRPLNDNLETYSISIFNRWGELIYRSEDFTVGWDGTYKGKNAELGVYSYAAEYSFKNRSEKESQSGNVTLIR